MKDVLKIAAGVVLAVVALGAIIILIAFLAGLYRGFTSP